MQTRINCSTLIMDKQRFDKEPIWRPSEGSGKKMKKFMKYVEDKHRMKFNDYWEFYKWSVDCFPELWADFWDFTGVICSKNYDKVIDTSISMEERPEWFPGAKLNFGENMLKFRDDHLAIIVAGEDRDVEHITYKELYEESKLYAAAFRKLGLRKGDVVSCYMSNRKEPVIAMIAVTSIGAVWTGGLPLVGSQAYLNRVKQVNPKFLITIDQIPNNKEIICLLENIKEIAEGLQSLEKVIIVRSKPGSKEKDISGIKNSCFLDDFLRMGYTADGTVPELVFEQVSFSHPVFINYTSGTTGLPKTIVHGFGGLMPCIRDYWLHCDTDRDDIWFSMSPVGWVSWNMVNHLLFAGETLFLYEGVPYFLSPTYFWDMVEKQKISRLFMTPTTLSQMEANGYLPNQTHHLKSLKMILCGSSVVKPNNYTCALKKLKDGMIFAVGCGSTETMGFFLICENTLPLYSGEISSPCLGVGVDVLDERGNSLMGELGEFVITTPLPSLPLGFWGDTDGKLYKKAYFSKYPGKFSIGDSAIINPLTKGLMICGRSDETLKPKGCRFGSSEIYNIVELFPEIRDSLCVAQYNQNKDERAILFIKMQDGCSFSEELCERLRKRVTKELSKGHVPEVILQTPDIPYNVNGKKMEIIVKKIINNMPHNTEMVVNPECLQYYRNRKQLQDF